MPRARPYRIATSIASDPPATARVENASRNTSPSTAGSSCAKVTITMSPPPRYSPTFSGVSFSAARPIARMPPMTTSQASTASTTPESHRGTPACVCQTSAIELVCVNGVVVSAASPATSAYTQASSGLRRPSRR
jgi:hypothetical protein